MSILKDARNLVLGNGDLVLAANEAALPSIATYKAALAGGTLPALTGNVGAIKGTVSLQIVREIIMFEIGVPQQTADMTCIREGVHVKCSLAELSLANVKKQIGGGIYSTVTAGATHITDESYIATASTEGEPIAYGIKFGPVLLTSSVPVAPANPVVKNDNGSGAPGTTTWVKGTDYVLDLVTNTILWLDSGGINAGDRVHINYYYGALASESLTGGGQADVEVSAVRFFHPYKDGRVLALTGFKMAPTGSTTVPLEEANYSHADFELRGIADFTRGAGANLWRLDRDVPQG